MDKLDQLGDKITRDPSVSDQEKSLIKDEKESVIAQWQELLSKTADAKNRWIQCKTIAFLYALFQRSTLFQIFHWSTDIISFYVIYEYIVPYYRTYLIIIIIIIIVVYCHY